jgi:WD40 repeat protein
LNKYKFASGTYNGINIWNKENDICIKELVSFKSSRVSLLKLSHNLLVSGCENGSVEIWNLDSY